MFRFFEEKRPQRQKPEKSVDEKSVQLEAYADQTNVLADKVDRLAESTKEAATNDEVDVKKSYGPVVEAGEHLADVLEKEEGKHEHSE